MHNTVNLTPVSYGPGVFLYERNTSIISIWIICGWIIQLNPDDMVYWWTREVPVVFSPELEKWMKALRANKALRQQVLGF